MTEFGVACNIGTSIFVITVVPAVAILISLKKTEEDNNMIKNLEISIKDDEEQTLIKKKIKVIKAKPKEKNDVYMMSTIMRDLGFFIVSLILYDFFLAKGIIYLYEAVLLFLVVFVYIFVIFKMEKLEDSKQKIKKQCLKHKGSQDLCESESMSEEIASYQPSAENSEAESISINTITNQNKHITVENESKFMHRLEQMCWPALTILDIILPVENFPMIAFLLIVVIFFASMDFILTVVSVISAYAHISHILIGLTFISWGSSPIELINLIISTKKNQMQIGITSILSGIVFAFLILMPLAMIFKMLKKQTHEIEILQPQHSSHLMLMPALVITLLTTLIYWKTRMNIGKYSASLLIILYAFYLGYMCFVLRNDKA